MKIWEWEILKSDVHEQLLENLSHGVSEIENLEDQNKKLKVKVKTESDIEDLISQKIENVKKLDHQKKEIGELEDDLTKKQSAVNQKEEEVSSLDHRVHELKLEFKAKDKELKDLNEETGQIQVRRQELSNEEAQLDSDITSYKSRKKANEKKQDVRQSDTISTMEDLEEKLNSLKQETNNLSNEKTTIQGLIKELNTMRGEHGIISALEFEIEKGEVSENWIKLFSVILDSKMNPERKNRIMLHLSARLDAVDSYRVNLDDTTYSEPAEKLLLLIQKYKNENSYKSDGRAFRQD